MTCFLRRLAMSGSGLCMRLCGVWCLVVDSRCQCYSAVEQSGCKYRCLTLSSLSVEKPGCYKGYI